MTEDTKVRLPHHTAWMYARLRGDYDDKLGPVQRGEYLGDLRPYNREFNQHVREDFPHLTEDERASFLWSNV